MTNHIGIRTRTIANNMIVIKMRIIIAVFPSALT